MKRMSDNATLATVARQWNMLAMIPKQGGGITVEIIRRNLEDSGFEVCARTVQRDLDGLADLFAIEVNKEAKPYQWFWRKDTCFNLPSLELSDALALGLLEQTLRPLLPADTLKQLQPRFKLAADKLRALSGNNQVARWADKVRVVAPTLSLLPPVVGAGIRETVQEALLKDEQIEVRYRSADADQASSLRLHPLGLVQSGVRTYLIAGVFDYPEPRLFALHRMQKVERSYQPIRKLEGFSLDKYIAAHALEFGSGEIIRLRARVDQSLARVLGETPLSADMTIRAQRGHLLLEASVADTWQLQWWILSQAERLRVLQPVSLRREIRRRLVAAAAQYAGAHG